MEKMKSKINRFLYVSFVLVFGFGLLGCDSPSTPDPKTPEIKEKSTTKGKSTKATGSSKSRWKSLSDDIEEDSEQEDYDEYDEDTFGDEEGPDDSEIRKQEEESEFHYDKKGLHLVEEDECYQQFASEQQRVCHKRISFGLGPKTAGNTAANIDVAVYHIQKCGLYYGKVDSDGEAIDVLAEIEGQEASQLQKDAKQLLSKGLFGLGPITFKANLSYQGAEIEDVVCEANQIN